jgi:lipoate---protein ligase
MKVRCHVHASRIQIIAHTETSPVSLSSLRAGSRCAGFPTPSQSEPSRVLHHRRLSNAPVSPLRELSKLSVASAPLVFRSSSINPYHNLSIEDYLLRHSHHSSRILFFYTNRPCVVIGRNQNPWLECDLKRLQDGLPADETDKAQTDGIAHTIKNEAAPIDLVRRRSGGGTVFHDLGNLNYSIIVPNDKDFNRRKHAEMVVRALKKVKGYDFPASLKVNARHDIVMQKHGQEAWLKVSGSAFKLTKGRALHHGTLLCSSPHLHLISALLRSPGRDYIQAKGVESVRSKVGNLTTIKSQVETERLRTAIIDRVVEEFLNLYEQDEMTADKDFQVDVSDDDCREENNTAIAAGVSEIMANEWRFGQTPRFDFHSEKVDGLQVFFHANRGAMESIRVAGYASRSGPSFEAKPSGQTDLNTVRDWKAVLTGMKLSPQATRQEQLSARDLGQKVIQNEKIMHRLQHIFPYFV